MKLMLLGSIATLCFLISIYFIRFWHTTRDRFFLFFAASFILEGVVRVLMGLITFSDEKEPLIYLIRLFSFLIIIYSIIDKNTMNRKTSKKR